jgi:uncharacterized protein YggU (UPF0235/DUF167 family)
MRITVEVKVRAREAKVEKKDDASYVVSVREAPKENEANFAVMEALAEHFHVSLSQIRLVFGKKSKNKI